MKKLLLILIAVTVASCSTLQYKATTYSIDYSKYAEMGFFITESETVSFEYTPVASVGSKIETGYTSADRDSGKNQLTYATADDALAYLVAQSQKLGANAIIGLKIDASANTTISAFTASGMAVKR